MTKQIFAFYFLLQERAKPIPPPLPLPLFLRARTYPHPPPTHPPIPHKKWFKDLFHIYYIDMDVAQGFPLLTEGAVRGVFFAPLVKKGATREL